MAAKPAPLIDTTPIFIENPIKALTKNRPERKAGKKKLEFSERERHAVSEMVALGFTQEQVARTLAISVTALLDHFDEELFLGRMEKIATVSKTMFDVASNPNHKAVVPAGMYILKTQGGAQWRDVTRSELTGADGKPLQIEANRTLDPAKLSDEDREALREMMIRLVQGTPQIIEGELIENDTDGLI